AHSQKEPLYYYCQTSALVLASGFHGARCRRRSLRNGRKGIRTIDREGNIQVHGRALPVPKVETATMQFVIIACRPALSRRSSVPVGIQSSRSAGPLSRRKFVGNVLIVVCCFAGPHLCDKDLGTDYQSGAE